MTTDVIPSAIIFCELGTCLPFSYEYEDIPYCDCGDRSKSGVLATGDGMQDVNFGGRCTAQKNNNIFCLPRGSGIILTNENLAVISPLRMILMSSEI